MDRTNQKSGQPTAIANFQDVIARCQSDALFFPRQVLGVNLWLKQEEILRSAWKNPVTIVRSCHGPGKTYTSAIAALSWLMSYPYSLVPTTAPTFRQVRRNIWKEIRRAYIHSKVPLGGNLLQTELNIDDGWGAFGISTDDPDAFQGLHEEHLLLIVDEAPGIKPVMWDAFDAILTSEHCHLLLIGNPTESAGRFYEYWNDSEIPSDAKIAISAFDTPNFTAFGITEEDFANNTWKDKIIGPLPYPRLVAPAWVADKYRRWKPGSPMYESRVLGQFPTQGTKCVIPLSWVESACARWETMQDGSPVRIGIDVARYGPDETVQAIRRGRRVARLRIEIKQATTVTAGQAVEEYRKEKAELILVDDSGVGGGVTDILLDDGLPALGINAGWAALDPLHFAGFRDEMWWMMRERLDPSLPENEQIALPPDEELKAQMSAPTYNYDRRGRICVESKEDMRARGLNSPDRGDAVILSFIELPEQKPSMRTRHIPVQISPV